MCECPLRGVGVPCNFLTKFWICRWRWGVLQEAEDGGEEAVSAGQHGRLKDGTSLWSSVVIIIVIIVENENTISKIYSGLFWSPVYWRYWRPFQTVHQLSKSISKSNLFTFHGTNEPKLEFQFYSHFSVWNFGNEMGKGVHSHFFVQFAIFTRWKA